MHFLTFLAVISTFSTFSLPAGRKLICVMTTDFRVGFANVNGLLGKIDFVKGEITAMNYDVFGIIETKIDKSTLDNDLNFQGFSIFRQDRTKGGGGVAAFVRS